MILLSLLLLAEEKIDAQVYKRLTTTTQSLTFNTFTAGEKGHAANSHILVANKEAIIVDAQYTRPEAQKLVSMVQRIGKPVTRIFITSSHPDRYLGLKVLQQAFPDAKVIAAPNVAADIKAQWPKALEDARARSPKEVFADEGEAPVAFAESKLELAGNLLDVIAVNGAETAHAAALYVPSLGVLVTGNLCSGKAHAALGEHHEGKWQTLLDDVKKGREVGPVLTGRGDIGDASLLDEMKAYLKTSVQLKDADRIIAKFPKYKVPQLLH